MKRERPQHCLFIGNHYPKAEDGSPISINGVWHTLLEEGNPDILSEDIISAALHSRRDLIRLDNLIKIVNLCSHWAKRTVTIEEILFAKEDLEAARANSGIVPNFFSKRRVVSARHREALKLCRLIGEGKESDVWSEDLKAAALKIAEKGIHTSATSFLRVHRYRWEESRGKYTIPNVTSRDSVINRNKGREINWLKEGATDE